MENVSHFIHSIEEDILKAAPDNCNYRLLQLTNEMRILLIHDPSRTKAAASMDVNVGAMSDPDNLPGLAHLCEHILMSGSAKYSEVNDFMKFIHNNAGVDNASMSLEHTNYYFEVLSDHLEEALDRFAQCFMSPLFMTSDIESEISAIHSEYQGDSEGQLYRTSHVHKEIMNPDHPLSKFINGDMDTLGRMTLDEMRDELFEFHKKYYSSNLMSLAVIAKETLDELTEIVVPLFAQMENKRTPAPGWPDPQITPLYEQDSSLEINIVPLHDINILHLSWQTENMSQYYRSGSEEYLKYVLNHTGPGSLLAELREKNWANKLTVEARQDGHESFSFFELHIHMTEEGLEHMDETIELFFQFLKMLRQEGPQEWIYEEVAQIHNIKTIKDYDRCNMEDLLKTWTYKMHSLSIPSFKPQEILFVPFDQYKPEHITSLLNRLSPRNMYITLISKTVRTDLMVREKWCGTECSVGFISESRLQSWEVAEKNNNFHIPARNDFIPSTLCLNEANPYPAGNDSSIQDHSKDLSSPTLLHQAERIRISYKQNVLHNFSVPKSCFTMLLKLPGPHSNLSYEILVGMLTKLVEDAVREVESSARAAGLEFYLVQDGHGFVVTIKGHYEKQNILLQRIMEEVTNLSVNHQCFETLASDYIDVLYRVEADENHLWMRSQHQAWSKADIKRGAKCISFPSIQTFIPFFLSSMCANILVSGNITPEQAANLAKPVEGYLLEEEHLLDLSPLEQEPSTSTEVINTAPDPCNCKPSSDTPTAYITKVFSFVCNYDCVQSSILILLLHQMLKEPCYTLLRTYEQLAYSTACCMTYAIGNTSYISQVGFKYGFKARRFVIIIDPVVKTDVDKIKMSVVAFMAKFGEILELMEADEFQAHVSSLAFVIKNSGDFFEQHGMAWSECVGRHFDRAGMLATLNDMQKEDVCDFISKLYDR